MIRQCAWCLAMMGESWPYENKTLTHGMCEECLIKMKEKIEKMEDKRKTA